MGLYFYKDIIIDLYRRLKLAVVIQKTLKNRYNKTI